MVGKCGPRVKISRRKGNKWREQGRVTRENPSKRTSLTTAAKCTFRKTVGRLFLRSNQTHLVNGTQAPLLPNFQK